MTVPCETTQQKSEGETRTTQLYMCEYCGKYLTKKSLNYSHKRTCPALPENQNKPKPQPVKQEIKEEVKPELKEEPEPHISDNQSGLKSEPVYEQPNYYFEPPQVSYHERMRLERRHLHQQRIALLTQFIA